MSRSTTNKSRSTIPQLPAELWMLIMNKSHPMDIKKLVCVSKLLQEANQEYASLMDRTGKYHLSVEQRSSIEWICSRTSTVSWLTAPMSCGKTLIALVSADRIARKTNGLVMLLSTPKSLSGTVDTLKKTYAQEEDNIFQVKKYSDNGGAQVLVTSTRMLKNLVLDRVPVALVIDEGHTISNVTIIHIKRFIDENTKWIFLSAEKADCYVRNQFKDTKTQETRGHKQGHLKKLPEYIPDTYVIGQEAVAEYIPTVTYYNTIYRSKDCFLVNIDEEPLFHRLDQLQGHIVVFADYSNRVIKYPVAKKYTKTDFIEADVKFHKAKGKAADKIRREHVLNKDPATTGTFIVEDDRFIYKDDVVNATSWAIESLYEGKTYTHWSCPIEEGKYGQVIEYKSVKSLNRFYNTEPTACVGNKVILVCGLDRAAEAINITKADAVIMLDSSRTKRIRFQQAIGRVKRITSVENNIPIYCITGVVSYECPKETLIRLRYNQVDKEAMESYAKAIQVKAVSCIEDRKSITDFADKIDELKQFHNMSDAEFLYNMCKKGNKKNKQEVTEKWYKSARKLYTQRISLEIIDTGPEEDKMFHQIDDIEYSM